MSASCRATNEGTSWTSLRTLGSRIHDELVMFAFPEIPGYPQSRTSVTVSAPKCQICRTMCIAPSVFTLLRARVRRSQIRRFSAVVTRPYTGIRFSHAILTQTPRVAHPSSCEKDVRPMGMQSTLAGLGRDDVNLDTPSGSTSDTRTDQCPPRVAVAEQTQSRWSERGSECLTRKSKRTPCRTYRGS